MSCEWLSELGILGRDVRGSTSIRWCVVHRSAVTDPVLGDPHNCARAEWEPDDPIEKPELSLPCRIVSAKVTIKGKLVDPPKEEDR